jgi:xanthine dehydrogenase YagT iron-sulfur-binding subunit
VRHLHATDMEAPVASREGRGWRFTRRLFLESSTALAVMGAAGRAGEAAAAVPADAGEPALQSLPLQLTINGTVRELMLDPRTTLLDALREHLGLTGSKKGCDHGQCGACTVLVGGRRINACLSLAMMHHGDEITTIEGLAKGDELSPLQAAFVEHDGFQCGYCTPGQICSATGMLHEVTAGMPNHVTETLGRGRVELSDAEIQERMSGNICRCAAYPNIVAAIRQAAETAP